MSTEHEQDWPEVALVRYEEAIRASSSEEAFQRVWWTEEPAHWETQGYEVLRYVPASKLQAVREELERRAQAAEVKADTQLQASLEVKDGFPALKDSATVWGARSLAYKEAAELLGQVITEGEGDRG